MSKGVKGAINVPTTTYTNKRVVQLGISMAISLVGDWHTMTLPKSFGTS